MNGIAAAQEVIQKDPGVILHLDFREAIKGGNKIRGDRWPWGEHVREREIAKKNIKIFCESYWRVPGLASAAEDK